VQERASEEFLAKPRRGQVAKEQEMPIVS